MSQVEVTDSDGYGYGLAIPNPPKTHTRDTGLMGIMGIAELRDQVTASCNDELHHQRSTTLPDSSNDHKRQDGVNEMVGM